MIVKDVKIDINNSLHLTLFRILNIVFNWKLSEGEIKILSSYYDKNEELRLRIPYKKERMQLLFSSEIRKELVEKTGLTSGVFANSLVILRKKKFIGNKEIIENNQGLNPWGIIKDMDNYSLTIKFENESDK